MANSLRAKISKLRHDGNITNEKYQKLISKLDRHDKQIRAEVIDEVLTVINALPKDCDCEYDLTEKVSKSKVLEAIEKIKEQL